MENSKGASILARSKEKAKSVLGNSEELKDLAYRTQEKIKSIKVGNETIQSLLELVNTFLKMVIAHLKGEYRETPWRTLILLVTGLLYFINPFDIIPDFIPVTGLLDDLTLLLLILRSIRTDVDQFKEWEGTQHQSAEPEP